MAVFMGDWLGYIPRRLQQGGHRMKKIVLAAGLAFASAPAAFAQGAPALCHHAGLTYSFGSMITMGKSLQKCEASDVGGVWAPKISENSDLESANCFYDGKMFGHGSVLDAVSAILKCSNGIWYPN